MVGGIVGALPAAWKWVIRAAVVTEGVVRPVLAGRIPRGLPLLLGFGAGSGLPILPQTAAGTARRVLADPGRSALELVAYAGRTLPSVMPLRMLPGFAAGADPLRGGWTSGR